MKPLILLVDDDPNILKYLRMILEHNNCQVIIAENGKEGLKVLSELENRPDLIISDIMMSEMNGYDFFSAVSNNPAYCDIPFIFLSALDTPEDIRLGKILGADDYLTKPINEDDLLAVIAGKIKRSKKVSLINKKINEYFSSNEREVISEDRRDLIILVEVLWNDIVGPEIANQFPNEINVNYSLSELINQLYEAGKLMYGQGHFTKAEGILTNVENFNIMSYVFFDSYPDKSVRGGVQDFMFSLIASHITYFQSLKIKPVLMELSSLYKRKEKWDIEEFWNKISNILTKTSIETHLS